jgi:Arc/MetJ-type ribon-helix-helix transcriptional regulator
MAHAKEIVVRLPEHLQEAVSNKVLSGEFGSENELIVESVRALVEGDADIEHWLRNIVAPTYDSVMSGEPTRSAAAVLDALTGKNAKRDER